MFTWQVNHAWAGLIADCGVFRGEWPSYAPLVFPSDAGEIDLVVALPPPDGDLEHLLDGSYPSDNVDAYRFGTGPTLAGGEYQVRSSGGSPGTSATTPSGAHLYVIWYDAAFNPPDLIAPPSLQPLDIVPQGMTAGAHGPARGERHTGHWSAWQPTIDKRYSSSLDQVVITDASDRTFTASTEQSAVLVPQIESDRAAVAAGASGGVYRGPEIVSVPPGSYGHILTANEEHTSSSVTPYVSNGPYGVGITQFVVTADGSGFGPDLDSLPTPMGSLQFGIDYIYPWEITPLEFVDYEFPSQSLVGWDDWLVHLENTSGRYDYASSRTYPPTATFLGGYAPSTRVALIDAADLTVADITSSAVGGSFPTANWPGPSRGTEAARLTPPATSSSDTSSRTFSDDLLVPLGSVGAATEFTAAVQPDALYNPSPMLLSDFPIPDTTVINFVGLEAALIQAVCTFAASPQVVYRQPRYRYWVPGPVPAFIPLGSSSAIRLNQRIDGRGIAAHPRRIAQADGAQDSRGPRRIGGGNTYF